MISWISVSNWIILSFEKGTAEEGREGKKNPSSTCSHTYASSHTHTHTLTCKHKLVALPKTWDLCKLKASHSSISLSGSEGVGVGVCHTSVCHPSSLTVTNGHPSRQRSPPVCDVCQRSRSTGQGLCASLPQTNKAVASPGPRRQHSGKIGFPPMAIRRTVKADSSLLTKA